MSPEKRITKHQMKEDRLVTSVFIAFEYLQRNYQRLAIGVGVVLVVILAVFLYGRGQKQKALEAEAACGQAQLRVTAGDLQGGILDLRRVMELYGGTAAGQKATYFLANAYLQARDYNQAQQLFRQFIAGGYKERLLVGSAHMGLGVGLEETGQTAEAAGEYLKAVEISGRDYTTPEYALAAIRALAKTGQKEKALELFNRLLNEFPRNFTDHNRAREFLARYGIFDYGS